MSLFDDRIAKDGSKLPAVSCPACGDVHNAATCIDDLTSRPSPGDFSVCISCGAVLRYEPNMTLREICSEDTEDMDDECKRVLATARHTVLFLKGLTDEQ